MALSVRCTFVALLLAAASLSYPADAKRNQRTALEALVAEHRNRAAVAAAGVQQETLLLQTQLTRHADGPVVVEPRPQAEQPAQGQTATSAPGQSPAELMARMKDMLDQARVLTIAPCFFVCLIIVVFATVFRASDDSTQEATVLQDGTVTSRNRKAGFLVVVLLTSYRFFTGFLNATWMSFLIAKEGANIAGDRQAFMMAGCKLIFGGTIILNPVLGLLNDRLSLVVHWCGRASFLLMGVTLGAVGIIMCQAASSEQDLWRYIIGISIWMLGEAMADTTTEAIVPEYLEPDQFHFASSVRSLHFVLGGITGFAAIVYNEHETSYMWLYIAYLMLMFTCACATVLILQRRTPATQINQRIQNSPLWSLVIDSYCMPLRYSKAFNILCFSLCLFSMGTGPIFFTLLFVRDLVDVKEDSHQQDIFGKSSIVFLVFAAFASIFVGMIGTRSEEAAAQRREDVAGQQHGGGTGMAPDGESEARTCVREVVPSPPSEEIVDLKCLSGCVAFFAITAAMFPLVHLPHEESHRIAAFYTIAAASGASFGGVYARFQTLLWFVLPSDADFGNAMGFSAVCKVLGCGLGNFAVGTLLDVFREGSPGSGEPKEQVAILGYVLMCSVSAALVLGSAFTIRSIPLKRTRF